MEAIKQAIHENNTIIFGYQNIETLNDKSFEVTHVMSKRKINIFYLHVTRWVCDGSREKKVNQPLLPTC